MKTVPIYLLHMQKFENAALVWYMQKLWPRLFLLTEHGMNYDQTDPNLPCIFDFDFSV